MTHEDLLAKLDARQALIVHFSAHAVMREGLDFPTDLQQVLAENESWPLSCSVLTPAHRMDVTGSVGVVLRPRTIENVLRVHFADAGAYDDAGTNQSLGALLSDESFDASIDKVVPGTYNEWRVRAASPVGIFVLDPANIFVRQKTSVEGPYGPEEVIAASPISLDDVRTIFPGQTIWTMTPKGPREL
ncbi:hypothetical protein [Cereibacter sphaeroides]|jgi:hypothetical protein|uniref:hypothetical protein n=1 Tax=Cereibacter sphaeroides TaxID=1063 RepID=UPI000B7803E8|nr:hypothetical protein [Cereibacter sphaeroides]